MTSHSQHGADARRCPRRVTAYSNRREFLRQVGGGLGTLALADLLAQNGLLAGEGAAPKSPLSPRAGHFPARAKSVIWLFMEGGPSGFDLFDPKPQLDRRSGERVAIETHRGNPGPLLPSPFSFQQYGQSGTWVCDQYKTLAAHVDDIALIKSVHTESPNHAAAMYQINTGLTRPGFPSTGAWVTYGLGSENQDLPGFVVLPPTVGKGGANNWGAGFLPGSFQATLLRTSGQPILNLDRPADISSADQRAMLDLAARLNAEHLDRHPGEADLLARIDSFELAYRMQAAAPSATQLASEPAHIHQLYGLDRAADTAQFGTKCLLARRLVERGVRFVQVYSNDEWDAHGDVAENHGRMCAETDVPIAGLLTDLKQRGLLESTLVVWGGEFGRMPVSENEKGKGRDHNPHGFVMWMAGGGIRGGTSLGQTDDIGYAAAVDPVSVPDIHATILNQLGLDHERLTYKHNGRQYRLTDVAGTVLRQILA